jgi:predicted TPR repeat methyltransferase
MLKKASERGVYNDLFKGELTRFMQSRRAAYDLIVSADTLVYFGVLTDAIDAASGALRRGGLLVFTVEEVDEAEAPEGHRIRPHGRYTHTRSYVERTLESAGFTGIEMGDAVLRNEGGEQVHGLVVTARKARQNAKASSQAS